MYHGFHGDVILVSGTIPQGVKPVKRKSRGFVLAEGEVTGHAHVVEQEIALFEDENGTLWIDAKEPFEITHEEHNKVEIPSGTYEVRIAKEYDHFAEEARRVAD